MRAAAGVTGVGLKAEARSSDVKMSFVLIGGSWPVSGPVSRILLIVLATVMGFSPLEFTGGRARKVRGSRPAKPSERRRDEPR